MKGQIILSTVSNIRNIMFVPTLFWILCTISHGIQGHIPIMFIVTFCARCLLRLLCLAVTFFSRCLYCLVFCSSSLVYLWQGLNCNWKRWSTPRSDLFLRLHYESELADLCWSNFHTGRLVRCHSAFWIPNRTVDGRCGIFYKWRDSRCYGVEWGGFAKVAPLSVAQKSIYIFRFRIVLSCRGGNS